MKKILLAGVAGAFMLVMGSTANAAGVQGIWEPGTCHRYVNSLVGLRHRHNCAAVDTVWDVTGHDLGWHYGYHHNVDGNGYCTEHDCPYEDCMNVQGNGHCQGGGCQGGGYYVNGFYLDGQTAGSQGSEAAADTVPGDDSRQSADSPEELMPSVNPGIWGNGYGNGSGCHGSGHHGGRHH